MALGPAGYQRLGRTTIEQWLGRLYGGLDTMYTFETIVRLVQKDRLQLPGALSRAAKKLKLKRPNDAALRLLNAWRIELAGQLVPPGCSDQDAQGLCLRLGVKNRWQAVLVAVKAGWLL